MYDAHFYDLIRPGCQSSAKAVIDLVFEYYLTPKSVIDIGCGEGWFGAEFGKRTDCKVYLSDNDGFESPNKADGIWLKRDLETEIPWNSLFTFDLAICLEVAEHLTETAGANLVNLINRCTDNILWSAAIPGQGGHGHVNEQWPNYWIHQFNDLGFFAEPIGLELWENPEVEPWYKQNLYLLTRSEYEVQKQNFTTHIHPAFWKTRVTNGF